MVTYLLVIIDTNDDEIYRQDKIDSVVNAVNIAKRIVGKSKRINWQTVKNALVYRFRPNGGIWIMEEYNEVV